MNDDLFDVEIHFNSNRAALHLPDVESYDDEADSGLLAFLGEGEELLALVPISQILYVKVVQ
jgi:hypothetical protein